MLSTFFKETSVIYIIVFSLIAGFASEEILIINVQFLVAICFAFFIIFAYLNTKDIVVNELEERSNQIQKEFDEAFFLKEEILQTIISYYKKQSNISEEINSIYKLTKDQVDFIISSRKEALESKLKQQIASKFEAVLVKEKALYSSMQAEAINYIVSQILNAPKEELERLDRESVKEAISLVRTIEGSRF